MQAYGSGFAHVYNQRWSAFSKQIAPHLIGYYEQTKIGRANKNVLDLCCGAGHLANHFLAKGYRLVGIDLSEHMLKYAEENNRRFVESDRARFVQGDAKMFSLDERFGLVVSTYDSLNHLESLSALRDCFACVRGVCDGIFIFDLNTRRGLTRWNGVTIDDRGEDGLILTRGLFEKDSDKAVMRISGFCRNDNNSFARFDETVFNTAFDLQQVRAALQETGWRNTRFASINSLSTPLEDPESEGRVFAVAER
ncbi:class I SAM-dependent methyltransferase [bacterium]|nr:class I SAM-dependent methyltransferase [bacterium]